MVLYWVLIIFDNLVCIQWGSGNMSNISGGSSKSVSINYPISFSSIANVYLSNSAYAIITRSGTSSNSFNLSIQNLNTNSGNTINPSYSWLAIGY